MNPVATTTRGTTGTSSAPPSAISEAASALLNVWGSTSLRNGYAPDAMPWYAVAVCSSAPSLSMPELRMYAPAPSRSGR